MVTFALTDFTGFQSDAYQTTMFGMEVWRRPSNESTASLPIVIAGIWHFPPVYFLTKDNPADIDATVQALVADARARYPEPFQITVFAWDDVRVSEESSWVPITIVVSNPREVYVFDGNNYVRMT